LPVAKIELSVDETSTSFADKNKLSELTSTFPESKYFSSRISLSSASISSAPVFSENCSKEIGFDIQDNYRKELSWRAV
jgi:hypothetical protein